jgi:pyruvate/2-oxoglutarate dehydrogenase complex dihydrolipoamide dehydrogenase (E3) component
MHSDVTDFDLIVLGLGPGGEEVAGSLAQAGWSVLGIDERLVGGECPYFGCIPSKMILRAAETLAEARRVDALAGSASVRPDFTPVADRIRDEATDDWDDRVAVERLEGKGVRFVRGTALLAGRDGRGHFRVAVGEQSFTARRIVVATGTLPALPPIGGLADLPLGLDGPVWTNREVLRARRLPASLVVLGGGAIGCELAQGLARFGVRVTMLEAAPRILLPEEPDASAVIADVLTREGVRVLADAQVQRVGAGGDGVVLTVDGQQLSAERLLVAAGRRPNLAGLGLDSIGLDGSVRALEVDDTMQVAPDVFAVGDVTGRGAFTHVAIWQARVLVAHLLGQPPNFGGYDGLAWVSFTDPEVGRVGLTEDQAREQHENVRTGTASIAANSRGWIHGPGNEGFVKLVAAGEHLVGGTVVAPNGGEILGLLTLAVHARVPLATLASMHYAFPTMHRAVLEALTVLR